MNIPMTHYPAVVVQDRYGGTYTGGEWLACHLADLDTMLSWAHAGDGDAARFSSECPWAGVGTTPGGALERWLGLKDPFSIRNPERPSAR